MRSLFANLAVVHHDDVVGALNCREPVGHND